VQGEYLNGTTQFTQKHYGPRLDKYFRSETNCAQVYHRKSSCYWYYLFIGNGWNYWGCDLQQIL